MGDIEPDQLARLHRCPLPSDLETRWRCRSWFSQSDASSEKASLIVIRWLEGLFNIYESINQPTIYSMRNQSIIQRRANQSINQSINGLSDQCTNQEINQWLTPWEIKQSSSHRKANQSINRWRKYDIKRYRPLWAAVPKCIRDQKVYRQKWTLCIGGLMIWRSRAIRWAERQQNNRANYVATRARLYKPITGSPQRRAIIAHRDRHGTPARAALWSLNAAPSFNTVLGRRLTANSRDNQSHFFPKKTPPFLHQNIKIQKIQKRKFIKIH